VQVQANLPQLVLVKEIMSSLLDQEELYGECGERALCSRDPSSLTLLSLQGTTWPL
jgi:hypothetical protein